MAEIEAVDAAELAALEEVATAHDIKTAGPKLEPHGYLSDGQGGGLCALCGLSLPAKWHVTPEPVTKLAEVKSASGQAAPEPERPVAPATPFPSRPLQSFVEAAAVDQRLATLEAELAHMKGMVAHTMLLVMILADRQRVTAEEYDKAKALAAKAEQKGPR